MTNDYIYFKQQRDFGEVFNATFAFARQNAKPLLKIVLQYAGPIVLVAIIISSLGTRMTFQTMERGDFSGLLGGYLITILSGFVQGIAYILVYGITFAYISLYIDRGNDEFTAQDVWETAKASFWQILGYQLLVLLIVGLGVVLCVIPGIYLAISLSFATFIGFYEKKDLSTSFTRSFELVKGNWWFTFGIIIVMAFIIAIVTMVVILPLYIVTIVRTFSDGLESMSLLMIVMNVITTVVSIALSILPIITIVIQYFNLVEQKENPELVQRVQNIYNQDNSAFNNKDEDHFGKPKF